MGRALLLTGSPGVGKTTAVARLAELLPGVRLGGFLTREIRGPRGRLGFGLETFTGESAVLARLDRPGLPRVGRYGVDVSALDRLVDRALDPDAAEVFLVDEIGKMECLSARFVSAMGRLLDGGRPLVATVSARGSGFIAQVKRRPDVEVWEVTIATRDGVPDRAHRWLERVRRAV